MFFDISLIPLAVSLLVFYALERKWHHEFYL